MIEILVPIYGNEQVGGVKIGETCLVVDAFKEDFFFFYYRVDIRHNIDMEFPIIDVDVSLLVVDEDEFLAT